ncbi:unnamed protein product, partial [Heterotrigona itama]
SIKHRGLHFNQVTLENAVFRWLKSSNGEMANSLEICWIRFLRTEPYKMFYKTSMSEDVLFKILDLLLASVETKKL